MSYTCQHPHRAQLYRHSHGIGDLSQTRRHGLRCRNATIRGDANPIGVTRGSNRTNRSTTIDGKRPRSREKCNCALVFACWTDREYYPRLYELFVTG